MSDKQQYRQSRFTPPPGACEIVLVRHGESAPADPEQPFALVDGHGDPPLHPDGVAQADAVCERLLASGEAFAAVYVTTLQRTVQTARPLLDRLGIEPVVEPDLREVHLGDFEGGEFRKRAAEGDPILQQMWAEQRWDVIPNAEPAAHFEDRVRRAVERIAAAHADETVAVFCHGGVIGQILGIASSSPNGFTFTGADNASISHIVVMPEGRWAIRRFNDTSHLTRGFSAAAQALT